MAPDTDQLQEKWAVFVKERKMNGSDVKAMLADSLLGIRAEKKPVLRTVKDFADEKASWVRGAAYLVTGAVLSLGVAVVSALLGTARGGAL